MKEISHLLLLLTIYCNVSGQTNQIKQSSGQEIVHRNDVDIHNKKQTHSEDTLFLGIPFTSYNHDTILDEIKSTTDKIATHTEPQKFLGVNSDKSSNIIGLCAAIFGLLAAFFGLGGYVYQKKSAKSLREMQPKRLPFNIFSQKLYKHILTLDILTEIELSNESEKVKERRRMGYNSRRLLEEMRMPDDLIDLSCYEKYKNNDIYQKAYEIIFQWRSYNSTIDDVIETYKNHSGGELLNAYVSLQNETIALFSALSDFEDMFRNYSLSRGTKRKKERLFVKSTTEFAIEILQKYELWDGFIAKSFCDPQLLYHESIFDEEDIPMPRFDQIDIQKDALNPLERIEFFVYKLFTKLTDEDIVFRIQTKKYSKAQKKISEVMHYWHLRRNALKKKESYVTAYAAISESPDTYTVLSKWLDSYFQSPNDEEKLNVHFLFTLLHAFDVGSRRASILGSPSNPFYQEEREYFKKKQKIYKSFTFFYAEGATHDEKYLSLYKILSSIVAEHSLQITTQYLQTWLYHDVFLVDDAWDDYMVSKELQKLDGERIIPLLEILGITNSDGVLLIDTVDELNNRVSPIPDNLLYNLITDSSAYIEELNEWLIKKV